MVTLSRGSDGPRPGTIEKVRAWAIGGVCLAVAAAAGLLSGSLLGLAAPEPITTPPPGPPLESVSPAQLQTLGLRLDQTVQPVALPDWLASRGVRPPATILMRQDAEATVKQNGGDAHSVVESALVYATLSRPGVRPRDPTIFHRLVWAVVGTRTSVVNAAGLVPVLWLVDAHSGYQLAELMVPGGAAPVGGMPVGSAGGVAAGP